MLPLLKHLLDQCLDINDIVLNRVAIFLSASKSNRRLSGEFITDVKIHVYVGLLNFLGDWFRREIIIVDERVRIVRGVIVSLHLFNY